MATTNYSWALPTVGGSENTWGTSLNSNWDALDTLLGGTDATEFAILNGATVTTAELNILDGVTATTAEINLLDGVTATTAEINYLDGVTSNIQTQLDAKAATASLGSSSTRDAEDTLTDGNNLPDGAAVKAYVDNAVSSVPGVGIGQTWQDVTGSRSEGTSYQNTSGGPMGVAISHTGASGTFEVSTDGVTWVVVYDLDGDNENGTKDNFYAVIPDNHYYRMVGGAASRWSELS